MYNYKYFPNHCERNGCADVTSPAALLLCNGCRFNMTAATLSWKVAVKVNRAKEQLDIAMDLIEKGPLADRVMAGVSRSKLRQAADLVKDVLDFLEKHEL